jgi:hypothetical protein
MTENREVMGVLRCLNAGERISFSLDRQNTVRATVYRVNNGGDKQFISRTYPNKNIISVTRVY